MLRSICENQRPMAENAAGAPPPLARTVTIGHGQPTVGARLSGVPAAHQYHTPSPQGRQAAPVCVPPSFSKGRGFGRITKPSAVSAEPFSCFGGGTADGNRQGRPTCPCEKQPSFLPCAAPLQPVVTRSPSRALAALPLVPVRPRSPVAALLKGQPSVPQATSPIAISTPDAVPNASFVSSAARPACGTRIQRPAQRMLSRGFCLSSKTQKDITCSRKS